MTRFPMRQLSPEDQIRRLGTTTVHRTIFQLFLPYLVFKKTFLESSEESFVEQTCLRYEILMHVSETVNLHIPYTFLDRFPVQVNCICKMPVSSQE